MATSHGRAPDVDVAVTVDAPSAARPAAEPYLSGTVRPEALADLETAIDDDPSSTEWVRIRSLLDGLAQFPHKAPAVIGPAPEARHGFAANLIAGIAEKIADDAGLERPAWARDVKALPEPWDPSAPARARRRTHAETPPQLQRRNIYIAASDLWRQV